MLVLYNATEENKNKTARWKMGGVKKKEQGFNMWRKDFVVQKKIFCLDAVQEGENGFCILKKLVFLTFNAHVLTKISILIKIFKGVVQFSMAILMKQTPLHSEHIALRYTELRASQ